MQRNTNLYDDYVEFKGWQSEETIERPEDYAALIALAGPTAPGRVLDIGAGRGTFLDWCQTAGIETYGTEIIAALAARNASRGHKMLDPGLGEPAPPMDLITLLDVIEHLSPAEAAALLTAALGLLGPDGRILLRFPNGQSPFSGLYQNGDLTHVSRFTPASLRQLAEPCGLELAGAFNHRSMPPGLRALKRRAAYWVRDMVETVLGLVYFGRRVPLDPNIVVVLRRKA